MLVQAIVFIIVGLIILISGAEGLVRGSGSIAKKLKIPSLVIGLTIVAFGTSAPELIVNIFAALKGSQDIAIGNIVGSNIFNIFLILGLSAIVYPLSVKNSTIWKEIPFALLAVILLYVMGNDSYIDKTGYNALTRTDGIALLALFGIFMVYIISMALSDTAESPEEIKDYSWPRSIIYTVAGLLGLFFGGKILVDNAVILATAAGLSEILIGLTIVAMGTSLPELATSVVAAYHRQSDIAVGNVVGSNIFNVFLVLGLTGTMLQLPFNTNTNFDVLVAVVATSLLFLFMFVGTKRKLDRWQGMLFVSIFIFYMTYLFFRG